MAAVVLCAALCGCTAQPRADDAGVGADGVHDPYEAANRRVHAFNTTLDAKVVRPLSRSVKGGGDEDGPLTVVSNVSRNLSLPGKVVNSLLQGRAEPAARNLTRFVINTTLGLGGIHDPAGREFGLTESDTDFGETLHVWGAPEGAYLELPVLGPSSERDLAGRVVDWVINPTSRWLNHDQRNAARVMKVLSKAGDRARFGSTVDSILHESADSYAQTRLLYMQHRRYELGQEAEIIDPYTD